MTHPYDEKKMPIGAIGPTQRTAFTDLVRNNDKSEEDIATKKQEQKKRLDEEIQEKGFGKTNTAPNVGSGSVFTAYMPTVNSQGSGDASKEAGFLAFGETGTSRA